MDWKHDWHMYLAHTSVTDINLRHQPVWITDISYCTYLNFWALSITTLLFFPNPYTYLIQSLQTRDIIRWRHSFSLGIVGVLANWMIIIAYYIDTGQYHWVLLALVFTTSATECHWVPLNATECGQSDKWFSQLVSMHLLWPTGGACAAKHSNKEAKVALGDAITTYR